MLERDALKRWFVGLEAQSKCNKSEIKRSKSDQKRKKLKKKKKKKNNGCWMNEKVKVSLSS